jgi:hypothetical protein
VVEGAGSPSWDRAHRLFFTRADQLLSVEYDPKTVSLPEGGGEVRSVISGVRTRSPWEHANAHVAADGTACFAPGGVTAARRRIMLGRPDGSSEPWCPDVRPFAGEAIASPDGTKVIATIADPTGLYELWISDAPGAPFRRLAGRASEDLVGACFSNDSTRVYFGGIGRLASNNAHYSMPLNTRAEPAMLKASTFKWYFGASMDPRGTAMYACANMGSEAIDLVRMSMSPEGGYAGDAQVLIKGAPTVFRPLPAPDGRFLAFATVEQSIHRVQVARVEADGSLGLPTVVATSEADAIPVGWSRTGPEKRLELIWTIGSSIEYQPMNPETGAPDGPRRSIPRPDRLQQLGDGNGFGDGRYLYVERGADEEPPRALTIVTGATRIGSADPSSRRDGVRSD